MLMTRTPGPYRLTVTRPALPSRVTYEALIDRIWDSGWLTNNGPLERELTARLTEYLGAPHLQLVSSGTSALQVALAALECTGEVITTPYSFAATRNAVIRQGCEPVYCDIDPVSFTLDPQAIEASLTPRTSAIVITTAYGLPANFDAIQELADVHGIPTLYDHAHATGARYRGRALATYGDIGALSFHATKVFHTGEGGALISHDPELDEKISLMKANGIDGDAVPHVGFNAKMSEMHAAMGLALLPELDALIARRKACFTAYVKALADAPVRLIDPDAFGDFSWNYAYFPVVTRAGEVVERIQAALADEGIESRRYFRPSFDSVDNARPCPVARDIASRVLSLPFSPFLTEDEIAQVAAIVRRQA